MKEIRLHGRGGQGVVTAAELIAQAAFADGKFALAFPSFGSERMGAPVQSFVKISDSAIRGRNQIYEPDYLIIQDATLIGAIDVTRGLKPGGLVIVDTEKTPAELGLKSPGNGPHHSGHQDRPGNHRPSGAEYDPPGILRRLSPA